ncbi:hypothetical protein FACS189443_4620 [Planctomycetales bacterium]|nr:hypothetical protein FACS189443_4620 [Planctomycetales bacterium]
MNLQGIYTLLLELYSSANGSTTTPAKANEKSKHLHQPHFCWFGTGTPEDVMSAFTNDNIDDGLIARINFFYASPTHKNKLRQNVNTLPPLPADIENEITEWACRIPSQNDRKLGRLFACPDIAPYTEQAIAVFKELETELENLEKRFPESCVIAGKMIEEAKKLALIAACSEFRENPQIDEQHARWGADLALFLAKRKMNITENEIGKNEYVKKTERVLSIVKKKIKTKGRCTETDLCVALQKWTKKEKHIVIEGMINGGMIKREKLCEKFKPVIIYSPIF